MLISNVCGCRVALGGLMSLVSFSLSSFCMSISLSLSHYRFTSFTLSNFPPPFSQLSLSLYSSKSSSLLCSHPHLPLHTSIFLPLAFLLILLQTLCFYQRSLGTNRGTGGKISEVKESEVKVVRGKPQSYTVAGCNRVMECVAYGLVLCLHKVVPVWRRVYTV